MHFYSFSSLLLLFSLFFFSHSDFTEQLKIFKEEVLAEHENILKFWEKYTVDEENGGFIGQIDSDMKKQTEADKGVILNSRITWAFSAAYRFNKNSNYLKLATRAYNYLIDKFYDHDNDGVYFMIDYKGNPTIVRNQVIAVAFVTYAFSEYYIATEKKEALDYALKLFNSLELYALDKELNGYFDAFSNEWEKLEDMRMYPGDKNATKTMNANFHIMVAYANIYRVYKDDKVKKALKNLIEVLLDKIVDVQRGSCNLFFDSNWNIVPSDDNYGLDIEASWLIWDAAQVLNDQKLIEQIRPIVLKMVEHSLKYGYDMDGGMMNEGNDKDGVLNTYKSWWVQAESVIAFFNAYQMTNENKYLANALLTWDFIKKYVIDYEYGEWYGTVGKDDHKPNLEESKIGPWKCPYHNSRMGLQIAERIDSIINEK
jgi:mannobiose 2-epimerase